MRNLENGYSLLTIAGALLITGLIIIGGMFLVQKYNIVPKNTQTTNPTAPEQNEESVTAMEPLPTPTLANDKGGIEGTFIFPSEQIPNTLMACAEHTTSKEIYCSDSLKDSGLQNAFMIQVPEGSYYVYAINTADSTNYKAYYTEFVTCGLLASCPSHNKIAVNVKMGEATKDVKPHDWYDTAKQP